MREFASKYPLPIIFVGCLILRLICFPFAQETDADGVSRVFIALDWLQDPHWIRTGIWAPLHYYFLGGAISIFGDQIFAPKFVTVLFSVLTLILVYRFTQREFNRSAAIVVAISMALCPLLMRLGYLALSETPTLFFIALAMNLISKGIRQDGIKWIIVAGLSMTIAAGFRYDPWVIIGLLFLALLVLYKPKAAIAFLLTAMIFPCIWMLTNYQMTGDALFGFSGNKVWLTKTLQQREMTAGIWLRRIWFYPFSWFIALGPIMAFFALRWSFDTLKANKLRGPKTIWVWVFVAMCGVFLYTAITGSLILQQRFTSVLVILGLPLAGAFFQDLSRRKVRLLSISLVLTLGLSFAYNMQNITPVPRLKSQQAASIAQELNQILQPEDGLIVDYLDWESTYYVSLHSKRAKSELEMINVREASAIDFEKLEDLIVRRPTGLIVSKRKMEFFEDKLRVALQPQSENGQFFIYRWSK